MLEITETTINNKQFFILNAYLYIPSMPNDGIAQILERTKNKIKESTFYKQATENGAIVSIFVWPVRPEMLNSPLKPQWADDINKAIDEKLAELVA